MKTLKKICYRVAWKNVCACVWVEGDVIVDAATVLRWMIGKSKTWLLENSNFRIVRLKGV